MLMDADASKPFWRSVLLTTLAAGVVGLLLGWRGWQLRRMVNEQSAVLSQLAVLREQNERLRAQRDALLSSAEAIEMVARQDYGFAAPGEKVTEFSSRPGVPRRGGPPRVEVRVPPWQRVLMSPLLPLAVPAAAFVIAFVVLSRPGAAGMPSAGGAS